MSNHYKNKHNHHKGLLFLLGIFYLVTLFSLVQVNRDNDKLKEKLFFYKKVYGDFNVQFYLTDKIQLSEREKHLLALNVFYEAGTESYNGKIAVAQTTFNRYANGKWGDLEQTIYAPDQFSWTLRKKNISPRGENWYKSLEAVDDFVDGIRIKELDGAMFYHADYVLPSWIAEKNRVIKIGKHIFYEE